MAVLGVIFLFVTIGLAVVFVAFAGGGSAAREAYLTRGRTFFRIAIPLVYLGIGVAIPAVVIANSESKVGGVGALANETLTHDLEEGKLTFQQSCASCHTLKAVNAHGVQGPNLDQIGEVNKNRILQAIKNGGTGQRLMPANLLQGEDAENVAEYVSSVAGR